MNGLRKKGTRPPMAAGGCLHERLLLDCFRAVLKVVKATKVFLPP